MGGVWGGHFHDPIHFEAGGLGKHTYAAVAHATGEPVPPASGGAFYTLANFLSGFVPFLGEVQMVDSLVSMLDGNQDLASWYVQHPAEALRDLAKRFL
jgi:hypothetical protein